MPKGHRHSRSQGYYRLSPTTPTSQQAQYQPLPLNTRTSALPNTYYPSPIDNLSTQSYNQANTIAQETYTNGGPVQHPSLQATYSLAPQVQAPSMSSTSSIPMASIRPSSGAWTPQDDATLMGARAQGMNWAPIQQTYFASKTANACRKRHERLMERKSVDEWDGMKLESMAKCYMDMRKEIWQPLADRTGEKWNVVEAKCMTQGLKNLQTQARSHSRRERLLDANSNPSSTSQQYPLQNPHLYTSSFNPHSSTSTNTSTHTHGSNGTEDSGIAGLSSQCHNSSSAYTPTPSSEDLDYENHLPNQHHNHSHNNNCNDVIGVDDGRMNEYSGYHSHSSSGGSGGSRGGNSMNGWGMSATGMNAHGGRLPSMDMGIEAIINRPNQGR